MVANPAGLATKEREEIPQFYKVANPPRYNILYRVRHYSNATHSTHPVRLSLMRCTR